MLSWVEYEKSFITSGPGLTNSLLFYLCIGISIRKDTGKVIYATVVGTQFKMKIDPQWGESFSAPKSMTGLSGLCGNNNGETDGK